MAVRIHGTTISVVYLIKWQMFLTDVLFSSLWLHFSEVQKIAMLDWTKQMGAADVLLLWAMKRY